MIIDHTKNEIYYKKGTGVVQFEDSDETSCFVQTGQIINYVHKNETGNFALKNNVLTKSEFNCFFQTGAAPYNPPVPIVQVAALKINNSFYQSVCKTGVANATINLNLSCATNWIGTGGSLGHSLVFQLPSTGELTVNDIGLTYKAINLSQLNSHMCFKAGASDIVFADKLEAATVIWDGQCWNGFNF